MSKELIEFFDRNAEPWDGYLKPADYSVGAAVLERAGVNAGHRVLDVACGTGVLTPLLLARGVTGITAVDISPGMGAVFGRKFPKLKFVLGDYHEPLFGPASFDRIIIYNAFPHFGAPERIIANAAAQLVPGGRLVIAHSMTRQALDLKHKEVGGVVGSHLLLSDEALLALLVANKLACSALEDADHFYLCAENT